MAAITRLGLGGGPRMSYGSFAGKTPAVIEFVLRVGLLNTRSRISGMVNEDLRISGFKNKRSRILGSTSFSKH